MPADGSAGKHVHLNHAPAMQVESFSANATDIITSVRTSLPAEADVDLSQLDDAEQQLADARDTLLDVKSDVRNATDGFHGFIIAVAIGAILCAILGLLCVFVRVRPPSPSLHPLRNPPTESPLH